MAMVFEKETNIYQNNAIASKFRTQDTQFQVINGKIAYLISDQEIEHYEDGSGTITSRMNTAESTIEGNTSLISELRTDYNALTGEIEGYESSTNEFKQTTNQTISTITQTVSTKTRTFNSQPTPPYSVNDLWFKSKELYICTVSKSSGQSYSASDWMLATKYTDDAALTTFIQSTYAGDMSELQTQIDGKIETWNQSTDPSSVWTTSAEREKHVGDLWYRTTDSTTWRYTGSDWIEQNIPTSVLSTINGKAKIFVSTPTVPYSVGDLWVQGSTGDILKCKTARTTGNYTSTDWEKASKYTDDTALTAFVGNVYTPKIDSIESTIDGKIDTWFYNYAPTLDNVPAKNWDSDNVKNSHLDDIFYNISTGYCYRFTKSNNVYSWARIKDSDITSAMTAASAAQDTADGKRRIFTVQPVPPYDVGDLWVQGSGGDILKCKNAKTSGNYSVSDWEKASKYTDDTALTSFVNSTYNPKIASIEATIDGKIDTWFYAYVPTLSNAPASSWSTTALKDSHLDDIFYDTSTGYCYRFTKSGSNYSWTRIKDTDITSAMTAASKAQDTADGKRRVFTATPAPPYDIGDLWVQGSGGDIMKCKTAKTSGSYSASDWEKASKYTDDTALTSFVNTTYNPKIAAIEATIDGKIDTWFYAYEPALNNAPASSWTTTALKDSHLDDIFYNTETGYCYRFTKSGSTYLWVRIKDSDITSAMTAASNAQDTADGKRRVFVNQPIPPYDVGDLWTQGASGDILKCKTARASGSYNASDWEKASKYTDDTALSTFVNSTYNPKITSIESTIDGKIDTWFYAYTPASNKEPTSLWNTTDLKNSHLDDIFYDTTTGYCYRYTKSGSTYSWTRIKDSDITSAMSAASSAQDTADGKRRVFTSQPVPPYDIGDLWTQGASGDILKCKTARASGNYSASDWEKASKYTDDTALTSFVSTIYTPKINIIESTIDGKIDTWFYAYAPTLSNAPASDWNTADLKNSHLDDIFYNTSTGYCYRFTKSGDTYSWDRIKDSDITSAMSAASIAQDTADGKRRVFVTQPTPPYDIGDLWAQGSNGDILTCKTKRTSGNYNQNDWEKASKYTDDSSLSNFISGIYNPKIQNIESTIDGKIDTWFYNYEPTLNNEPASTWTSTDLKNSHLNDVFYNTLTGYCYRFTKSGNTYSWVRIKDTDITSAMTAASLAQDTADHKRRVFTATPTPPYDIGDLWVQGSTGDILKCKTAKASSGSYALADWEKASKYTDDTALNNWKGNTSYTTFQSFIEQLPNQINLQVTGSGTTTAGEKFAAKASIIATINDQTYQSGVKISADRITLDGDTVINAINGATGNVSIQAKKISMILGGANNTKGTLQLLDGSNNQIGLLNKDGASLTGDLQLRKSISSNVSIITKLGTFKTIMPSYTKKQDVYGLSIQNNANTIVDDKDNSYFNILTYWDGNTAPNTGYIYLQSNKTTFIRSNVIAYNDIGAELRLDQYHLSLYVGQQGSTMGKGIVITTHLDGYQLYMHGPVHIYGNFDASGTKSRKVNTQDYASRLLYCYETASPTFGDIGDGIISNDGYCYIQIDPIFAETIITSQYQVFLQKYGNGDCYVKEKHATYFVICGTPNLSFGWELKAKQSDFDQLRLDRDNIIIEASQNSINYGSDAINHIAEINNLRN